MVFPVVMYGWKSWTVKKAEHWRIDAFELLCWRRLLRVLWTARKSTQSILKEISPGCSLEGLLLKLKLQYFGHLMLTHWKRPWCWEGFGATGEGDNKGWDGWMPSPTQWTWVWVNSGSWWWTGRPGVLWFMGLQRVGNDWATELNRTLLCTFVANLLQSCGQDVTELKWTEHSIKWWPQNKHSLWNGPTKNIVNIDILSAECQQKRLKPKLHIRSWKKWG